MQHPYTLGYESNTIIEKYQQAFFHILEKLWYEQVWGKVPEREFLLSPEIHSRLLVCSLWEIKDIPKHQDQLKQKYKLFLEDPIGFRGDTADKIPGTDIIITPNADNPAEENVWHPDHEWISIWYWNKSKEEWKALFSESFSILKSVSPGFMSEVNTLLRKVIAFGVSHKVHNSWSNNHIIGHILMSYPTWMSNPEFAILEAILHEYNHNKINLIMKTDPLILNDRRRLYYSPYRPDARHIPWIYLGIHALAWAFWVILHAQVKWIIVLWDVWLEKAILYVLKNWLSLQILDKYAVLTPLGKEILEEMRQVHRECLEFIKLSGATNENISKAKNSLVDHFKKVQEEFPEVLS